MSRIWPYIATFLAGAFVGVLTPRGCSGPQLSAPGLLDAFRQTDSVERTVDIVRVIAQPQGSAVVAPTIVIPREIDSGRVMRLRLRVDNALDTLRTLGVEWYYEQWLFDGGDSVRVVFDQIERRHILAEAIIAPRTVTVPQSTIYIPEGLRRKSILEEPLVTAGIGLVVGAFLGYAVKDSDNN